MRSLYGTLPKLCSSRTELCPCVMPARELVAQKHIQPNRNIPPCHYNGCSIRTDADQVLEGCDSTRQNHTRRVQALRYSVQSNIKNPDTYWESFLKTQLDIILLKSVLAYYCSPMCLGVEIPSRIFQGLLLINMWSVFCQHSVRNSAVHLGYNETVFPPGFS